MSRTTSTTTSPARRPLLIALAAAVLVAVLAVVLTGVLPTPGGRGSEQAGSEPATPSPSASAPDAPDPGDAATAPGTEDRDPDRFVISYDEDSPAAAVLAGVETYGEDILDDLPAEQREAILEAAAQASVVVESVTAHAGSLAAINLSEGLTDTQVAQLTALLEEIESISSVEPDLQMTPLDRNVPDDTYFDYQ